MIKNKVIIKIAGGNFKVVSSTAQNWPNAGSFISDEDLQKIIKMGFGVTIQK